MSRVHAHPAPSRRRHTGRLYLAYALGTEPGPRQNPAVAITTSSTPIQSREQRRNPRRRRPGLLAGDTEVCVQDVDRPQPTSAFGPAALIERARGRHRRRLAVEYSTLCTVASLGRGEETARRRIRELPCHPKAVDTATRPNPCVDLWSGLQTQRAIGPSSGQPSRSGSRRRPGGKRGRRGTPGSRSCASAPAWP